MGTPRIAFIGAGAIGLPMAARASNAGQVTVVDVSEDRLSLAREHGLATSTSLAGALPADIVLVMVATEAQARSVLEGSSGLYSLANPETTVAILSTLGPDTVRRLEKTVPQHSPELLDIPVTGGIPGAVAGTLTLFAAGNEALIDRHRSVLESMGTIVEAGPRLGDGQAFKMVNQLLATSQLVVAAEALFLAKRLGLDSRKAFDAVRTGAGASWMLENYGPRMLDSNVEDIAARLDIFLKDSRLVRETANAVGFEAAMNDATCRMLERGVELGYADQDASAIARAYADQDASVTALACTPN